MRLLRAKGSNTQTGFTIIETLIFLAVSALMFLGAIFLISGQQAKAQFVNGVRNFESQLADIANDVGTGYYQGDADFRCSAGGSALTFSNGGSGLGTNDECILLGTAIKFSNNGDDRQYTKMTLAGQRLSAGVSVTSLDQAKPTVIYNSDGSMDHMHQTVTLEGGITIQCIALGANCSVGGANNPMNAGLAFMSKLGGADSTGGGVRTDVYSFRTINKNMSLSGAVGQINSTNFASAMPIDSDGLTICLKSAGTDQYALIHLGNNSSNNLTFNTEIKSGTGPSQLCR